MAAPTDTRHAPRIPIAALGWSLGIFFAITYTVCVIFESMTSFWTPLLPWVDGISIQGYVLGAAETLLYGWFVALIFGPLFNFFAERSA